MFHGWHFIHLHVPRAGPGSRDRVVLNGDLCPTLAFMNEGEGGSPYRKGRVAGTKADSRVEPGLSRE